MAAWASVPVGCPWHQPKAMGGGNCIGAARKRETVGISANRPAASSASHASLRLCAIPRCTAEQPHLEVIKGL
ncbi:leucine-rich repeat receptor protein kinase exs-like protein [Lasius niger]|uniref:Leucine-rich repeat receptor protein kinase exs-like protein n=1 Tax=Lasius niger TaxID=67767 RepID=A0A0J7JZ56_LASNI|nr:leucine-rich repeat receptor protein kinase exs-like protein [Lasius niger]